MFSQEQIESGLVGSSFLNDQSWIRPCWDQARLVSKESLPPPRTLPRCGRSRGRRHEVELRLEREVVGREVDARLGALLPQCACAVRQLQHARHAHVVVAVEDVVECLRLPASRQGFATLEKGENTCQNFAWKNVNVCWDWQRKGEKDESGTALWIHLVSFCSDIQLITREKQAMRCIQLVVRARVCVHVCVCQTEAHQLALAVK